MPRGRPVTRVRRDQMMQWRAQGLTLCEIGRRLGITRQGVQQALSGRARVAPTARCRKCDGPIASNVAVATDRNILCLPCLAQFPEASLAETLRAYRIARNLTQQSLAEQAGVPVRAVSNLERGMGGPSSRPALRLFRLLGIRWVMKARVAGRAGAQRRPRVAASA